MAGGVTLGATGGPAAEIRCVAEARPVEGLPGRVTVALLDEHGNPASGFRGEVSLACGTDVALPTRYTFTEEDGGSHEFAAIFPTGRVSRVTVRSADLAATSNPILPRATDEPGIYFGDLHSHCGISADAVGDPHEAYDYARRFWGLDLAALSDHSPQGPKWQRAVEVANRHNEDGRFVTLIASEWSHKTVGHRNAYYRDDAGLEPPTGLPDNMQSWWDRLDREGVQALTVPHHTNTDSEAIVADGNPAWGPADWSVINDKYQRLVEICQNRGSFEAPGGPIPELRIVREDRGASVQTALSLGHRLGFIGSTDTHSGRPGTGTARCVVVTRDFSRTGVWDALHARSCYATTGEHILVFMEVNGAPMGSELTARPGAQREIGWRVIGTGPLLRVDLLRNNEVVESWAGEGRDDVSGELTYTEPREGVEWWYLRAIQEDTAVAWSSPVWIDPAP